MLRDMKDLPARPDRSPFSGGRGSLRRNIFKLKRYRRNSLGKVAHGIQIVVRSIDLYIRHLPRRRVRIGRQGVHPVPHAARGDRKHPPELAASKNANRAARKNGSIRYVPHRFKWRCAPHRFKEEIRPASTQLVFKNGFRLRAPPLFQPRPELGVLARQNTRCQQPRIRRPRRTDCQRPNRNTRRHLNDRKQ